MSMVHSMVRKRGLREYLNDECGTAFKAYEYTAIIDLRSKLRTGGNKRSLHNMRDTRTIVFFRNTRLLSTLLYVHLM